MFLSLGARTGGLAAAVVVALCWVWCPSAARSAEISDPVFTLLAVSDGGQGAFFVKLDEGVWDPESGTYTWSLAAPVELRDESSWTLIATLLNADLMIGTAQLLEIHLNIGLVAGEAETACVVASPLLSFGTVPATRAEGRATASFTLTDVGGDGARLAGLGTPGTGAFRAYYNGYLADGVRFTHLVGFIYVNNGGTATTWQADPPFGYRAIGRELHDMSSEIAFSLTPGDLAFAVTTWAAPAPPDCFGDISGDGLVDMTDVGILMSAYGTGSGEPGYVEAADLDANGRVDMSDLAALLAVYGDDCWRAQTLAAGG